MLLIIEKYLTLFFIYSFLGWAMETIRGYFLTKKMVNRGFLIGPYCPIYGIGICLLTALLSKYVNDFWVMFFMSIWICGTLEYFTSYIMEKIFKARWWDYHNRKFNINGRICLETLLPFGIVGAVLVGFANPFFLQVLNISILLWILGIISIIFVIDFAFSINAILGFRKVATQTEKEYKDDTEEISGKVKEVVNEKYEELKKNLEITNKKLQENITEVKEKLRRSVDKEKQRRLYINQAIREKLNTKSWRTRRLIKAFPNFEVRFNSKKEEK